MKRADKSVNTWIGFIVLIIIVLLGVWWISLSAPGSSGTSATASSTAATSSSPAKSGSKVATAPKAKVVDSTVVGVVRGLSEGSRFASLFSSTGVAAALRGSGPYTVFVPTNAAYSAASSEIAGMSSAQKQQLVEYHVVVGRAMDPSALLSGSVMALSRQYINFGINTQGKAQIDNAYVVASYKATNGIVYLVSNVLFPPKS